MKLSLPARLFSILSPTEVQFNISFAAILENPDKLLYRDKFR